MSNNPQYPNDLLSVIHYLDERFPERCARPGMTLEDIWREAGARQVVNHLKMLLSDLEEQGGLLTASTIKKS